MNAPVHTGDLAPSTPATPPSPRAVAFEALYHEHHAFVWRCARRLCVDEAELEDVIQDVFVVAYRRLDQLEPDVAPSTWLFGILRNVLRNRARGRGRHRRRVSALADAIDASERRRARLETEIGERVLAGQLLHGFLRELDPSQREVFVLAELEGHTAKEIAAALAIKPNTASSRLRLARRAFCDHFGLERGRTSVREATRELREHPLAPPAEVRARSWGLVLAAVGRPAWWSGGIGSALTLLSGKVGLVLSGVTVSAVLLAGAWGTRGQPASTATLERPSTAAASSGVHEASSVTLASSEHDDQSDASASTDAAPIVIESESVEPRPARARVVSPSPSPPPSIAAEQLRLARAALLDGDPAEALALLDRIPARDASLADARTATRVAALCKLGEVAQAQAEVDALRRRAPTSSVLARIDRACW